MNFHFSSLVGFNGGGMGFDNSLALPSEHMDVPLALMDSIDIMLLWSPQ